MEIKYDSIVLVKLTIQKDGQEYTVGDPSLGEYIRVPYEAVEIIKLLDGIKSISEVITILKENNIDVDVLDFVKDLYELDFVYSIDGQVCNDREIIDNVNKNSRLPKIGKLFFNRLMNTIYLILFCSSALILIANPSLIPTYDDMFVFNSTGLSLALMFITSWLLVIIHEAGHYLATIKLGIPVRFSLSIRFYWLVVEADMTSLWSVSKNKRYIPYMGGMCFDSVILFTVLILQFSNPSYIGFLKLITLILFFRFGWQCLVFLRTDIYYIVMNAINVPSLHDSAKIYLKNLFGKKKLSDIEQLSATEIKYVKGFTFLYIFGALISLLLLTFYSIPGFLSILSKTLVQLTQYSMDNYYFWDGLLILIVLFINMILWIIGVSQKYRTPLSE